MLGAPLRGSAALTKNQQYCKIFMNKQVWRDAFWCKRCSRWGIANVARQRVPGSWAGKTERLLCHGKSTEWNEVVPARTWSQSHISTRTTQIHEVARRSTMHDIVHQCTQLVSYPTRYRKPVKLPHERHGRLQSSWSSQQPCSCALHSLKSLQNSLRTAGVQTVAVVDTANEGHHEYTNWRWVQKVSHLSDATHVIIARSTTHRDLLVHPEILVDLDSQIPDRCWSRDCGAIRENELLVIFSQMCQLMTRANLDDFWFRSVELEWVSMWVTPMFDCHDAVDHSLLGGLNFTHSHGFAELRVVREAVERDTMSFRHQP